MVLPPCGVWQNTQTSVVPPGAAWVLPGPLTERLWRVLRTSLTRWAWPVVEKSMGRIQAGVVVACKQVERIALLRLRDMLPL